jgi:hypothetical protein
MSNAGALLGDAYHRGRSSVRELDAQRRRKDQAMATLMQLPAITRIKCAAGLLFSAAADTPDLQPELAEMIDELATLQRRLIRSSEAAYKRRMIKPESEQ